jgi:inosine-uridine nucleoside N-ribohydrolase
LTSIPTSKSAALYIDSDNAHGSPSGDVDDAFALSALISSSLEIKAIASVFGNTSGELAFRNSNTLLEKFQSPLKLLAGAEGPEQTSEASDFLCSNETPLRVIALGPLTNISMALKGKSEVAEHIEEIVIVGSNSVSRGTFPPIWPFEYNLVKDRQATRDVFHSGIPLRIIPLNQAGRLRIQFSQLDAIEGKIGEYLRLESFRWFRRAKLLKLQGSVPIWDLVAAMACIKPELFLFEKSKISVNSRGATRHGAGEIPATTLRDYSPAEVWQAFLSLINDKAHKM